MTANGVSIGGFTTADWDRALVPRIQDFEVQIAERVLKDAVAKGFDREPTVVTDGVPNRDWHDVKPFGKIEWVRKSTAADAARWIMAELTRRSPVGSGDDKHPGLYARSHIFMINGAQAMAADLDRVKPGDEVQIVNIQPYAGKIEGADAFTRWDAKRSLKNRYGLTRRGIRLKQQGWSRSSIKGQSSQAPDGVYRVVLAEAAARFGRATSIRYAPTPLSLGVKVSGQEGGRRWKQNRPRKRVLRPQIYPCFTIVSKSLFV